MRTLLHALAIFAVCAFSPARAAMTEWVEVHGGAVRLISSGPLDDGRYLAGLEFLMEPGWHTYWRYAGEAGIPPQISMTASENVAELDILYPVPERYHDGFTESIVYHDGVVLPFRITPNEAEKSARMEIEVFFGICKDICVPGDAVLSLDFQPDDSKDALASRLIERDLAAVPKAQPGNGLEISSVTFDGSKFIIVETKVSGEAEADLFAAGPEGSYIGLPKFVEQAGDKRVWRLSTKGLKTSQYDDTLRLVLTSGGHAIEHLEAVPADWVQ
ncbi:protein-disulfide reductase DsbD domain-containing protein [Roseibium sp. HPY-6]|uniref:protein-disulfide reductase DsbD domain-containing protein n=1 Tax=Roseibium sp. HPY-6 TaxID=3229852 RepID=UPI0033900324